MARRPANPAPTTPAPTTPPRNAPTIRHTVTAYHPANPKPLVFTTYDDRTLAETRERLTRMGYTRVEVETEAITSL